MTNLMNKFPFQFITAKKHKEWKRDSKIADILLTIPGVYSMPAEMRQIEGIADGSPIAALAANRSAFFSATAIASAPAVVPAPIASKRLCSKEKTQFRLETGVE